MKDLDVIFDILSVPFEVAGLSAMEAQDRAQRRDEIRNLMVMQGDLDACSALASKVRDQLFFAELKARLDAQTP